MRMCNCKDSTVLPHTEMKRYGLLGDRHTAFMVNTCTKCGCLVFFPHENAELAAREGTEETINTMANMIIKWIRQ